MEKITKFVLFFLMLLIFSLFFIQEKHPYFFSFLRENLQRNIQLKSKERNKNFHFLSFSPSSYFFVDKIKETSLAQKHIKKPPHIRAIYMSRWIGADKERREKLIDFVDRSDLNAIVLDIKDYSGELSFPFYTLPFGMNGKGKIQDIENFISELHQKNIYLIGRVTVFQDPLLAEKVPHLAFKRKDNGELWRDKTGLAFINPKEKSAWDYYVAIAKEAYQLGFDEINFDYIRYPSDGDLSNLSFALSNGETKREVMQSFFRYLNQKLRKEEQIPISADFFGFVASQKNGLPAIGQKLEDAIPYFDALALMVYPSHYPKHYLNFENPAAHPYEVVFHEMAEAMKKLKEKQKNGKYQNFHLRTWIQDFPLGAFYGEKEVRSEIKGSFDAGVFDFMVWDPRNRYTQTAYNHLIHK